MNKDRNDKPTRRNLHLVEKYDNDDYSRYAGPDFSEDSDEREEDFVHSAHQDKKNIRIRPEGNWHHPGVSGKADDGETWVNNEEYNEQTNFVGYGPKNYRRSDDRIYEEVCETLMQHREVDASNIGVKVENGVVYLSGKANDRRSKKMAELIIEDLPGVQDVRNELSIIKNQVQKSGPDSATKNDLGLF